MLIEKLKKDIKDGAPVLSLIDEKKLTDFMAGEKDYGAPWYGQLMAGPQFIGYIVQMNYLLRDYKVRIL